MLDLFLQCTIVLLVILFLLMYVNVFMKKLILCHNEAPSLLHQLSQLSPQWQVLKMKDLKGK